MTGDGLGTKIAAPFEMLSLGDMPPTLCIPSISYSTIRIA